MRTAHRPLGALGAARPPRRGSRPRWIPGDLDGDGLALAMRVRDPGGELVEAREFPGLLVERTLGLYAGANLPAYPGTRGTTNAAWATYLVRGTGTLHVRIGAARPGFVSARIEV